MPGVRRLTMPCILEDHKGMANMEVTLGLRPILILISCLAFSLHSAQVNQAHEFIPQEGRRVTEEGNRVAICRTRHAFTRRPLVEIQVFSPRPMWEGNMGLFLTVGERSFIRGRYGDSYMHVAIFWLSPEQFAELRDGAEMIVQGPEGVWKLGKLNKRQVRRCRPNSVIVRAA